MAVLIRPQATNRLMNRPRLRCRQQRLALAVGGMPQACRPGAVGVLSYGCDAPCRTYVRYMRTGGGDAQWRSLTISDIPVRTVRRAPRTSGGNPQDLAAEQSVLGGMLLSKDAIADVLERLRPGDFYRPAHQNVYDAILDLYGRGEPADAVTVGAELDRRACCAASVARPSAHADLDGADGGQRRVLRGHRRGRSAAAPPGGGRYLGGAVWLRRAEGADVDEIVDRAQAEIYDVTERRTSEDFVPLEQLPQPTMDEIDAIASQGGLSKGVPTGFTELDELTRGLHPGQMVVVAARPGMGKAPALDTPLPTPTGWTTMGEGSRRGPPDRRRRSSHPGGRGDRGHAAAALLKSSSPIAA